MKKRCLIDFLKMEPDMKNIHEQEEDDGVFGDIPDNSYYNLSNMDSQLNDIQKQVDNTPAPKIQNSDIEQNIQTTSPDFTGAGEEVPINNQEGVPTNNISQDPYATTPGLADPMMGGLLGIPEPLDPSSIGKMYILKKIYIKILAIHDILSNTSEPKFDSLKKIVDEGLDHFENFVKNFDQFKDKLDQIIVLFQRFLVGVVDKIQVLMSDSTIEEDLD